MDKTCLKPAPGKAIANDNPDKCPLCKHTPRLLLAHNKFSVLCPHCGLETRWYRTKEEAVKIWNQRS